MKEIYEFRVQEKYASQLFEPNEGEKLGWTKQFGDKFVTVRKIKLTADDPKFNRIGELNALIQKRRGDFFFAGWEIQRRYTAADVLKAKLFLLCSIATFEPAGEECGTQYDESLACPSCKSGARQVSPLFLDWKRIPKSKDIARTIAGEIVMSKRMVDLCDKHSITGAKFGPVCHSLASNTESKDWFQLLVKSCEAEITAPTKMGVNPFDEDMAGQYRCPRADLIGLARLSEVSISRSSHNGFDIVASRQFVGTRRGLLRPERLLLVSPKLRRVIKEEKLTGCEFEVAHFV
ncbi:MAG TPA: hypothetical protein VG938_09210 [Verrucomicrobiae bacterium]|jgi:hypothetical protein|nr:hypothetical protein [Verrucomicrobiae bacterium]